jgi:hypothetical protein
MFQLGESRRHPTCWRLLAEPWLWLRLRNIAARSGKILKSHCKGEVVWLQVDVDDPDLYQFAGLANAVLIPDRSEHALRRAPCQSWQRLQAGFECMSSIKRSFTNSSRQDSENHPT